MAPLSVRKRAAVLPGEGAGADARRTPGADWASPGARERAHRERLVVSESAGGAIFVESSRIIIAAERNQIRAAPRRRSGASNGPSETGSGQDNGRPFGHPEHVMRRSGPFSGALSSSPSGAGHSTRFIIRRDGALLRRPRHSSGPGLHLDLFILFVRARSIGSRLSAFFSPPVGGRRARSSYIY